jgi:phosphoglycerate dehydrogenase-like enzyme
MPRSPDLPTRKLLVLTYHRLDLWIAPHWFSEKLQREFPQLNILQHNSYAGIDGDLSDAEILFAFSLRPEQFQIARKLHWLHSPSAAVHQFMFPEFANSDVILTNARDVHGPVVAEHVMALILAMAKNIPADVRMQQKHVWGQEIVWSSSLRPREIAGATVGLVGVGTIGRGVAKHAHALGMKVIAVRQHPERGTPEFVDEVLPTSRLNEMLVRADYLVLAAPVTSATENMIGRQQLAQMSPHACLINVGRGSLVDEAALAEALRTNKIGGAALDVFEQEPLPADSPLWDLENLLITPHTAGMTDKLWERHYVLFSENLRRYLSGQPLLALVDKRSGY